MSKTTIMKAFNIKSFVLVLAIAAGTFISCKKDKDAAPPDSILKGTWEGAYGGANGEPTTYFSFIIENNGTLQVKAEDKNDPLVGSGTWTLKDNEFKAVYQYEGQDAKLNVAAKFDEVENNLIGNWGHGEKNADVGKFYMFRK
jgi:hypothetical protein